MAAGALSRQSRLHLVSVLDERSAAFVALGVAAATGRGVVVVTTSGTAVANLLPAAVEADRSTQPLLLFTADRPGRLKECGANQAVNQETFLQPACRWFGSSHLAGMNYLTASNIHALASQAWYMAHGLSSSISPPGPVHLNLPLEEPLYASIEDQSYLFSQLNSRDITNIPCSPPDCSLGKIGLPPSKYHLDLERPGVILAGPWRGLEEHLPAFQDALRNLQACCGWPVLADPLSAVPADCPGRIEVWEPSLEALPQPFANLQVLRLGPLSPSRSLERWLLNQGGPQLLISEGDPRQLDPLGCALQDGAGLATWWQRQSWDRKPGATEDLLACWQANDHHALACLERELPLSGPASEPALAFRLSRLIPPNIPTMLAASSPVRDWLSWSGGGGGRRCYGFRGASGIDGTLSLGLGLAMGRGRAVLVTGDLALIHDSNGWLIANSDGPPLLVVLVDNNGGGIFEQLSLVLDPVTAFESLFAMPQRVDLIALAASHGIPHRQLTHLEELAGALAWGLDQAGPALLRICTDRRRDVALRHHLRRQLVKRLSSTRPEWT